jgi:hypothetical protein
VSELLFITIKVPHGDLVLSPHDLGFKGFHSGRDISGLEGMTQTLTMIGASEGDLTGVEGRIK